MRTTLQFLAGQTSRCLPSFGQFESRSASYFSCLLLIVLSVITGSGTSAFGAVGSGYSALVSTQTGKCLDVPGGSTENNVGINQFQCDNSNEQSFLLKPAGGDHYNIIARHSGMCIDVPAGSLDDNVQIQQFQCDGSDEQKFAVRMVDNINFLLIAAHSGKCLDVPNGTNENNIPIIQFTCAGNGEQQFQHAAVGNDAPKPIKAPASPKAQFLNAWATEIRQGLPRRFDIFEWSNIYSNCPSGCENNNIDTHLAVDIFTHGYAQTDIPPHQIIERLQTLYTDDYCKNEAKNRNVSLRFNVDDKLGNYYADIAITPNDCMKVATAQPKIAPSAPQPTDTRPPEFVNYISQFRPIAHYPLTTNTQDVSRNSPDIALQGVQYHNDALYSAGVYQETTASAYPNNWNLDLFTISAEFYVNELAEDRPVFISGNRWVGYYLNKDGTVSMKYNNSNFVHSSLRYSANTWHEATVVYQDQNALFYLDGVYAGSVKVDFDFVNQNPTPSIGITDYSNGAVFKGWIKNLTVSNSDQ